MDIKKPSLTELLEMLNKPALVYWANNLGLRGVSLQKHKQELRETGTSLHKQIRGYVEKGEPFENPNHTERWQLFCQNKEILSVEKRIETEWFVGRYDVKLRIADTTYLCDFKSSKGRKVYFENILQLVAYRMAEPDCKIAIIKIPDFELIPIHITDFEVWESCIKCLHYLYKIKKTYELQYN